MAAALADALGWWSMPGWLAFMAAVAVLNATPGVDLLLTVGRTLQAGPRAGVATALGISSGCVVHVLLAAGGLATLLAVSPAAFLVLKGAGAAYLLWLALGLARQAWANAPAAGPGVAALPASPPAATRATKAGALDWAEFRTGLLTNVLNPKVSLFVLAFLPQFIPQGVAHKPLAFLALGGWMLLQSTLFSLAVVAVVAHLRRIRVPDGLRRGLQAGGAALFAVFAWRLVSSSRS